MIYCNKKQKYKIIGFNFNESVRKKKFLILGLTGAFLSGGAVFAEEDQSLNGDFVITADCPASKSTSQSIEDNYEITGTAWSCRYQDTLPGYYGTLTHPERQTKSGTGQAGLRLHATGGKFVQARTVHPSAGNGPWRKDLLGGNSYAIEARYSRGQTGIGMQLRSNLLESSTGVVFDWRSN
ncbi:hypothetical protein M3202_08635 [Alkalihalobacillus oceani]|uniref:Uncharacterized protein n=1 Tax=Halalkalibacter oceani TaxID=1653776 RepID=A0A9X2DPA2_9BACI|nr:hypothetical protein [Halalkalibacter oceani]MCM3714151.1 hypothetical protein [Halalkalibacter oceani]